MYIVLPILIKWIVYVIIDSMQAIVNLILESIRSIGNIFSITCTYRFAYYIIRTYLKHYE